MIRRRKNKKTKKAKKLTPSQRRRKLEREYLAEGFKPIKNIDELAFLTPKDADELLDAIRQLKSRNGEGAR